MSDGTKMLSAIQSAFERIGYRNGHAFPSQQIDVSHLSSNSAVDQVYEQEKMAYEYMVAGALEAAAKKRFKEAQKQAEEHGLLDGVDEVPAGQSATLYQGQVTTITVSVNNPATRLDSTKLKTELQKLGVSKEIVDKAVQNATVKNKPAKRIKATPVL